MKIHKRTEQYIKALQQAGSIHDQCKSAAITIRMCSRGTIFIAGNGGSAAEASHLTAELVGKYKSPNRSTYDAVNLSADSGVVTAIANDFGYDHVFSKQIQASNSYNDGLVIVFSTSGNSQNIINAAEIAEDYEYKLITFTGPTGKLVGSGCANIIAPVQDTAFIQEIHLHAIHLICELLEESVDDD